jgi:hypothetical protein
MTRGGKAAIAAALLTCGSAIAQGMWNQSGPDTGTVTLVLGRDGRLLSDREGNSAQSVQLWIGSKEATSAPVTDRAWLEVAGFDARIPLATTRHAFVVLDVGAEPGADGLSVVDLGREPVELLARYSDRSRYLIAPAAIRSKIARDQGDSLGTIYLTPNALHVPGGIRVGSTVEVRTGRSGVPYVVGGRGR